MKRLFDIMLSGAGLIVLAPVFLVVACAVKLSDGGSVLFKQERAGRGLKPFLIYKFRTMVRDADRVGPSITSAHDDRITPVGAFLRHTKLDELPQLFNVLRGDMSLVGPRPVLPDELVARYGRYAPAYLQARPGTTGMWQVNGRNSVGYRARIARDRYYARHWSLALDLLLILKTIPALLNFGHTA
jgi:exopolysaccharide production protein ExoY